MEVKVKLNCEKHRYHIFQIINLFCEFSNIIFVEKDNWDFNIEILVDRVIIKHDNEIYEGKFESCLKEKENIRKIIFLYFSDRTCKKLPWGTLIGIRPSKIALELIEKGENYEGIVEYFRNHFCCERRKAELCINVAAKEKDLVNTCSRNISVYVGMPFCPTRCLYCSFTSNPIENFKDLVEPYIESLIYEIRQISSYIKKNKLNIECIYFGGGTPTSVDDEKFKKIICEIYNNFVHGHRIEEFNVECGRPDSITLNKLKTMKKYGVNRISINPQTMNDSTLKFIGRNHRVEDIKEKFHMARECGFNNINMDIIVGLPGEGIEHIDKTCIEIEKLSPDSLTVHGMSVKRGSKLYENMINNTKYLAPDAVELNLMYERTARAAETLNMEPYYLYRQKNMVGNMENIGYAAGHNFGLYNIEMIEERQTIIGCGADAVTKVVFLEENRLERHGNIKDVKEYVNRTEEMVRKKIMLLNTLYGNFPIS
ncbi:coproporphyrinogen III oxidase [Clostridium kluyveri]|uniref:Coproporphyrinogen dehydrogenase HemZ n=1 Tax=Clostridium kluyveri TaxID=1534 RepID=A0A1L5FBL3_CLOKL|nr:coproporphyrinogen III oxidase [Clostridium kluyveri]APM40367.1 coproporphyrinogen dehydrogenase HemZ [Clostridium kluyveri]